MKIAPIDEQPLVPPTSTTAAAGVAKTDPTHALAAPPETVLQGAIVEIDRALHLVASPPRPTFLGRSPLETALGMLASAKANLAQVLGHAFELPDDHLREALSAHLACAIGSTLEAHVAVEGLARAGVHPPSPSETQAAILLLEDALAHARMSSAVLAGEP
jgi:hypothetical protein